jgi:hypothetical protein
MGRFCLSGIFCVLAAAALLTGCGDKAAEPPDDTPEVRSIVLRDSVFTDDDLLGFFFLLAPNDMTTGLMSVNASVGRVPSCNGSLTSDMNSTAGALFFTEVFDSTLVAEFFLRADSLCHTNFIAFLGKDRGSAKNTTFHIGMGFDMSDSVKYVWGDSIGAGTGYSVNVASIQLGHWYKCSVEFTYADTSATWYLDDVQIGHEHLQITGGMVAIGNNFFAAYRDGQGADGSVPYYLSDLTIYKK